MDFNCRAGRRRWGFANADNERAVWGSRRYTVTDSCGRWMSGATDQSLASGVELLVWWKSISSEGAASLFGSVRSLDCHAVTAMVHIQ